MKEVNEYIISEKTIALIPVNHMRYRTKIKAIDGVFYSSKTPMQIMEVSCIHGGASYDGRRQAVIYFTRFTQRVPIPVKPQEHIYAFPTLSPSNYQCIWIIVHHVKDVYPLENDKTLIVFGNYAELIVPVSFYTIQEQLKKTTLCAGRFSPPYKFCFWIDPQDRTIRRNLTDHLSNKEDEDENENDNDNGEDTILVK